MLSPRLRGHLESHRARLVAMANGALTDLTLDRLLGEQVVAASPET